MFFVVFMSALLGVPLIFNSLVLRVSPFACTLVQGAAISPAQWRSKRVSGGCLPSFLWAAHLQSLQDDPRSEAGPSSWENLLERQDDPWTVSLNHIWKEGDEEEQDDDGDDGDVDDGEKRSEGRGEEEVEGVSVPPMVVPSPIRKVCSARPEIEGRGIAEKVDQTTENGSLSRLLESQPVSPPAESPDGTLLRRSSFTAHQKQNSIGLRVHTMLK